MCKDPSSETSSLTTTTNSVDGEIDKVWVSPYNPLDKDAPTLPTKNELKAVIPKECFNRSYQRSFYYLAQDCAMSAVFTYATSLVLSTTPPIFQNEPVAYMAWVLGWAFYAFWQGTIWTGLWVLAHECGHGAFTPSQTVNDIVGFIFHQALMVPYFAWQFTHAKHHKRTNHILDGETHVPAMPEQKGLKGVNEITRATTYAVLHEAMGDGPFACLLIFAYLTVGWPLYLIGVVPNGELAYDGTPLNYRNCDHFLPFSAVFPPKMALKITTSTLGLLAQLYGLNELSKQYGGLSVFLWYWAPYLFTNAWLVLYTWLHHTDPSVPHYDDEEWTWMRGALGTIDRPYGIFDFFHHDIGSTHVCHHLFHELPWYNARVATEHLKAYLEPKGLYNYDPTPIHKALYRVGRTCHFCNGREGIQYYMSLDDVPRWWGQRKKDEIKKES